MAEKLNSPLISVIMPVYNTKEEYFRLAIESVLNQTFTDFEFIIIDDNSDDYVWKVVSDFQDNRIIYVKNETNLGVSYVRQMGLEIANGEYIAIFDSDDIVSGDWLESLYSFLSENQEYALAVGENKIIDEQGALCYWDINRNIVYDKNEAFYYSYCDYQMKWATKINFFSEEFGSYKKLLLGNHIPGGYLIRKNIFEKTGGYPDKQFVEDYYLMLQISKYAKMKYIPKPLYFYRWHESNTTKKSELIHKKAVATRLNEVRIAQKSDIPDVRQAMKDYLESFPKNYFVKIPFLLELYSQKTSCFRKIILKVLGIDFTIYYRSL